MNFSFSFIIPVILAPDGWGKFNSRPYDQFYYFSWKYPRLPKTKLQFERKVKFVISRISEKI